MSDTCMLKRPYDMNFGRFRNGCRKPLMAMVEVTQRCNMSCPVCFTDARGQAQDTPIEVIKAKIDKLVSEIGTIPLQISGGEPTLHPLLKEIVSYADARGFTNIELVTNGIRISKEQGYLSSLAKAGLSSVYLQFDGLRKDTYLRIRGQDMEDIRLRAIAAIRRAKMCCTLAVAVARNVNDNELGDIVRFGVENIDTVRAINFQAATRFAGRYDLADTGVGFTLEELIGLIEEQTGMAHGGFLTDVLGHHHCNAISLAYVVGGRLEPLFRYFGKEKIQRFLGSNRRETILDLFLGKERFLGKQLFRPQFWSLLRDAAAIFGKQPDIRSAMRSQHILLFVKSFMEHDRFDGERLHQCNYGIVDDRGIYSFCAYNNYHRINGRCDSEKILDEKL